MTLRPAFFWWVFRQWWAVILPVGLLLAGAAATGIMLTYKPDFRASALIMIEDSAPYIAFAKGADVGGSGRFVETQIELLRSPLVLEPVLSDQEIAKYLEIVAAVDPVAYLQEHLIINRVGASELYNISYISKSPQHAAYVANKVLEEYWKRQEGVEHDTQKRVIAILDEESRKRRVAVEGQRQNVMELAKQVTGRNPFAADMPLDLERVTSPIGAIYAERTQVEVQQEVLNAQIQALREAASATAGQEATSGLLDLQVNNYPTVTSTQAAHDDLVMKAEALKATLKPGIDPETNSEYQRIRRDSERLAQSLNEFKAKLRVELATQRAAEEQVKGEDAVASLERQAAELATRRKTLDEKYNKALDGMKSGNAKTMDFIFAQTELAREEKILELIESRRLAMQTERRPPLGSP